ncbi:MAG: hypothetical protein JXN61_15980, partial [Sedimentisphaerales bacterium]|nr:hypothetical protein [Sedimentisphaerales bacterium]
MKHVRKLCHSMSRIALLFTALALPVVGLNPDLAKAGGPNRVVWPYHFNNQHYAFLAELVRAFEAKYPVEAKELRFGSDDDASVGRFADKDNPFGVLIDYPETKHGEHRLFMRFHKDPQKPAQQILAQRRLIVVASRDLYLERISQPGLRWLLRESDANWPETTGEVKQRSSTKILLEGDEKSWTTDYLKAFILREKSDRDGVSGRFYELRKDIKRLDSAEKVLAEVRRGLKSIGIVVYKPGLDFSGVDVLATRQHWKHDWVKPNVGAVVQPDYRFGEIFVLYQHPSATTEANIFCQWAIREGGSSVLENNGLQTPFQLYKQDSDARLITMKAGKGLRLSVTGDDAGEKVTGDLATDFVRVKDVVQLRYGAVDSDVIAVGQFIADNPRRELLVLGDRPSEKAMEVHGKKWDSLGRDEDGQPDGTGPA